ncbi:hypothetical protein Nepgr_009954 [Nepenthes gracilis]|uniref:Uncharacterized protein n=1 Tax=Nepenthes gracilis TaxID=150966 RepID=A0AAD3XKU8_NEPGR|nr:hypothetical protein Nepgr_009954 [Nepenthes gracilis]
MLAHLSGSQQFYIVATVKIIQDPNNALRVLTWPLVIGLDPPCHDEISFVANSSIVEAQVRLNLIEAGRQAGGGGGGGGGRRLSSVSGPGFCLRGLTVVMVFLARLGISESFGPSVGLGLLSPLRTLRSIM